ncbi:MAG: rhomboid family intramembrane serine protease [Lachnospiraceae bacterium]|nr:rhomboid family intramembrane serine protease [Lachnospiraceae bacterium]
MDINIRKLKELPFISVTLVAANVVIFLLCQLPGNRLYDRGCLSAYEIIAHGEYARIIWSMFLHADVNHLFSNMIILLFMGAMIEKEIGHIPYTVIYLASGIGGNLLSLADKVLNNDWAASLGASGAIFGLDGLLLALVLFSRRKMNNVTPARVVLMICLSLYSGFTGGNVDNLAHIGGLLVGFVLGMILCIGKRILRR